MAASSPLAYTTCWCQNSTRHPHAACSALSPFSDRSLAAACPHRVHAKHLGFPLLGDDLYGGTYASGVDLVCGKRSGSNLEARQLVESFARPALHALTLGFTHPVTGDRLQFKSELADNFAALLTLMDGLE